MFFGTVTQGPIPRAGQLIPQLVQEHRFDTARTVRALRLYALGLFKMVAVSDVLGLLGGRSVRRVAELRRPDAGAGSGVLHPSSLYFNFSGYSELARAIGLLLGLELPENFKTPFFATNFSGFWSRWHHQLFFLAAGLPVHAAGLGRHRAPDRRPPAAAAARGFACLSCFLSPVSGTAARPRSFLWGLLQALYRVGEELLHRRLGKPKRKQTPRRWCCGAKRAGVLSRCGR